MEFLACVTKTWEDESAAIAHVSTLSLLLRVWYYTIARLLAHGMLCVLPIAAINTS